VAFVLVGVSFSCIQLTLPLHAGYFISQTLWDERCLDLEISLNKGLWDLDSAQDTKPRYLSGNVMLGNLTKSKQQEIYCAESRKGFCNHLWDWSLTRISIYSLKHGGMNLNKLRCYDLNTQFTIPSYIAVDNKCKNCINSQIWHQYVRLHSKAC
jgi:hypothetical protein